MPIIVCSSSKLLARQQVTASLVDCFQSRRFYFDASCGTIEVKCELYLHVHTIGNEKVALLIELKAQIL